MSETVKYVTRDLSNCRFSNVCNEENRYEILRKISYLSTILLNLFYIPVFHKHDQGICFDSFQFLELLFVFGCLVGNHNDVKRVLSASLLPPVIFQSKNKKIYEF